MIKHPILYPLNSHSKVLYNPINPDGCVLALTKPYIGADKWIDYSGYGNDGTIYGAIKDSDGSLSFDGIDDYVDCGNDISLNICNTIDFWFKPRTVDTLDDSQVILTKYLSVYPAYRLYQYNDTIRFKLNSETIGDGISVLTPDTLHHIIITYDKTLPSNNLKLFVNKRLISQVNLQEDVITNNRALHIGGDMLANKWFSTASIFSLHMLSYPLSISACLYSDTYPY